MRLILHRDTLPARPGVRGAMEFKPAVPDAKAFHVGIQTRGIPAASPVGLQRHDPDGNVVQI